MYRSSNVSAMNTTAPITAIARSSRLTKTLCKGLNVWLPCGTMPTAFAFVSDPNHRNTMLGTATNRPRTETSFAVSLAVRRKRNSARSRSNPTAGATITTEKNKAKYIGQ